MLNLKQGDCLELLKEIPDKSIDLVLTDPPYGTTKCKWDSVIDFEKMWIELKRVRKDNTAIVLFGAEPFSSALRMSNIKEFRYDWIWQKTTATGHLSANKRPLRAYEIVSVFYKKQPTYNPQKRTGFKSYTALSSHKTSNIYNKYNQITTVNTDGSRYPLNIIEFAKTSETKHPTEKPVALLEYFIKTYTENDHKGGGATVLDFAMGSGSTGVACINTNRKFIGFELNSDYFEIAKQRVCNHDQN